MGVGLALCLGLKKEKNQQEFNIRTPVLKMFLYVQTCCILSIVEVDHITCFSVTEEFSDRYYFPSTTN